MSCSDYQQNHSTSATQARQTNPDAPRREPVQEPNQPAPVPFPHPLPPTPQHLARDTPRIILVVHGALLAVFLPPVVVLPDGLVITSFRQATLRPRNPALDAAGDDGDDGYAKGRQLDAERVAVSVQSGLGRVVDGTEDVGDHACQRADLDDRPFRSDE